MAYFAVSIDTVRARAAREIARRKITKIHHLWSASPDGKQVGYQSPAARILGMKPIPECYLIDRDGKILFRGHPDFFEDEVAPLIDARVKNW